MLQGQVLVTTLGPIADFKSYIIFVSTIARFPSKRGCHANGFPAARMPSPQSNWSSFRTGNGTKVEVTLSDAKLKCCYSFTTVGIDLWNRPCFVSCFSIGEKVIFCNAMPPLNAATEIISSLSKAEIDLLRKDLRGKKLLLFQELIQKNNSQGKEIHSAFAEMSPKAYAILRSQLDAKVATLRGEYRQRKSPNEQIRAIRLQAITYQASGRDSKAIATFFKAAKLASSLEEYGQAAELMAAILLMMDEESPQARLYVETRNENIARAAEVWKMVDLLQQARSYKKLAEPNRSTKASELLGILNGMSTPQTVKGLIHSLRISAICLLMNFRVEESIQRMERMREIGYSHPVLLHDPLIVESLSAIHFGLSGLYIGLSESARALELLVDFERWLTKEGFEIPNLICLEHARAEIFEAWDQQNWPLFSNHAAAFYSAMEAGRFQNPSVRLAVSIDLASKFLMHGDAKTALKWVERAYVDRRAEILPEGLIVAAIIELTCLLKLCEWEILGSALDRASYLFESKGQLNEYTRTILKAFKQIDRDTSDPNRPLIALTDDLGKLKEREEYQLFMNTFDLQQWLLNHLQA